MPVHLPTAHGVARASDHPPQPPHSPFGVADWHVDPATGQVTNIEKTARLEPKAMDVQVYLAERPGAVVSRVELEASVWAGSVVGYDTVTGAIQKLRKAFGDNPRQLRVIETLSKKGYRLVAPVGPAATPTAGAERRADFRTTGSGGRRKTDRGYGPLAYRPMLVVALAVLLVGVVAGVLLWSE